MKFIDLIVPACLLLISCQSIPWIDKASDSLQERTPGYEMSEKEKSVRLIVQSHPDIAWDVKSFLKLDINDDGYPDYALMGIKDQIQVSVAVALSTIKEELIIHTLNFGVGPGCQNCIGYLPARLSIESMDYDPSDEDGTLPGFKRSKKAQGLCLSDDLTDSIHIFWNHQTNELDWWRL